MMSQAWLLDWNDVSLDEKLARGAFGEVWKAKYRKIDVAVKKMFDTKDAATFDDDDEIHFLQRVRGVRAWCSSAKRENFNHITFSCFNNVIQIIEKSLVSLTHIQEDHLNINARMRTDCDKNSTPTLEHRYGIHVLSCSWVPVECQTRICFLFGVHGVGWHGRVD